MIHASLLLAPVLSVLIEEIFIALGAPQIKALVSAQDLEYQDGVRHVIQ